MPPRILTCGEIADRITEKVQYSAGLEANRQSVFEDMNEVYQDFFLFGDLVGDHGWIWAVQTADVTFPLSGGTVDPVLVLTELQGGIPMAMRSPDGQQWPISLASSTPRQFYETAYDSTLVANPQTAFHASYDQATDLWSIQIWPVPNAAQTYTVLYQAQAVDIEDSYANADNLLIPSHLRHGIVKGTVAQQFLGSDRTKRYSIAAQEFAQWKEKARDHVARRRGPQVLIAESESRISAGRWSGYEGGMGGTYWGWA